MSTRRCWIFALMVAAAIGTAAVRAQAPIPNVTRASLKGLKRFAVAFLSTPQANKLELDQATLQRDIELRLRQAGITVISDDDPNAELPEAVLIVQLVAIESTVNKAPFVFSLATSVHQGVTLTRDPSFRMSAKTWWDSGVYSGGQPRERVRNAVHDQVDTFLNDYLTVNPKK